MKKLERKVSECIKRFNLIEEGEERILLGVSGGPDSMAMLRVFEKTADKAGIKFGVAHYNHRLRSDSDRDADFVSTYCFSRGIPFHYGERGKECRMRRESPEEFARRLRYDFLQRVARENNYHLIATAHTADDQVETMLMRMIRGTGIEGLAGIVPRTGNIIRPLLLAWREDVIEYLESEKLNYVVDPTNLDKSVPRNLLRNEVIPLLLRYYPNFKKSLLKLWQSSLFLNSYTTALNRFAEIIIRDGVRIPIKGDRADLVVLRHLLTVIYGRTPSSYITSSVEKIISQTGYRRLMLKGGWILERIGGEVLLRKKVIEDEEGDEEVLIGGEGRYRFKTYWIEVRKFKREEVSIEDDPYQAFMDADKVRFPVVVRRWKSGDRFTPLGMSGSKKVQDIFTDLKIPRPYRKNYPIFLSGGEIIWIGGIRISERVKVDENTRTILWFKITEEKREIE